MRGVLSSAGCLFLPHIVTVISEVLPLAAGHRIVGVLNFGRFFSIAFGGFSLPLYW
jgi:hypothetical protein